MPGRSIFGAAVRPHAGRQAGRNCHKVAQSFVASARFVASTPAHRLLVVWPLARSSATARRTGCYNDDRVFVARRGDTTPRLPLDVGPYFSCPPVLCSRGRTRMTSLRVSKAREGKEAPARETFSRITSAPAIGEENDQPPRRCVCFCACVRAVFLSPVEWALS